MSSTTTDLFAGMELPEKPTLLSLQAFPEQVSYALAMLTHLRIRAFDPIHEFSLFDPKEMHPNARRHLYSLLPPNEKAVLHFWATEEEVIERGNEKYAEYLSQHPALVPVTSVPTA